MDAPPIRYAHAPDGTQLAYASWGSGPVVTWTPRTIPQGGSLPYDLRSDGVPRTKVLRGLAETGAVLTYDSRGTGASGRDVADATLDTQVGDLAAVLDDAGVPQTVLMASHWATPIAVSFALRSPHRVRGIVMWEPSTHGYPADTGWKWAIDLPLDYESMSAAYARATERYFPSYRDALREIREAINEPDWIRIREDRRRTFDLSPERLRTIGVPVMVLHDPEPGRWDKDTQVVATAIPDCQLHEISGLTAHAVVELTAAFLARLEPTDPAAPIADGPPAPPPVNPHGLSPRELEVLAEVARGRRNAEIAAALVISPATVTRHVSNILSKTGCSNRTELGRYATDHGLAGGQ